MIKTAVAVFIYSFLTINIQEIPNASYICWEIKRKRLEYKRKTRHTYKVTRDKHTETGKEKIFVSHHHSTCITPVLLYYDRKHSLCQT